MLRMDELEDEKRDRYLGLIDTSADELAQLLDLLSLAARIEGGRYDPVVREADSLSLAPDGATGTGDGRSGRSRAGRARPRLARTSGRPPRGRRDDRCSRRPAGHDRARDGRRRPDRPGRDRQGPRRRCRGSGSCMRSAARLRSTASASPSRCRAEHDRLPVGRKRRSGHVPGTVPRTCPFAARRLHRGRRVRLPEAERIALAVRARREPAHAGDGHRVARLAAELLHAGRAGVDVVDVEVDARAFRSSRRPP